jgi:hypothetical protein
MNVYRTSNLNDLHEIERLSASGGGPKYKMGHLVTMCYRNVDVFWFYVVKDGDELQGYAIIDLAQWLEARAFVRDFFVHPGRRKGLQASCLMLQHLRADLHKVGCRWLYGYVRASDTKWINTLKYVRCEKYADLPGWGTDGSDYIMVRRDLSNAAEV